MRGKNIEKNKRAISCKIKKADIVLGFLCLAAAVLIGVVLAVLQSPGSQITVFYGNDIVCTLPSDGGEAKRYLITYPNHEIQMEALAQDTDIQALLAVQEDVDYNLLKIEDGFASIEAANCKDQICARHKPISAQNENIICLPHRLVVEITDSAGGRGAPWQDKTKEGKETEELDGMVK